MKYRIVNTSCGTYIRDGIDIKEFDSRIEAMAYMEVNNIPREMFEVVGYFNGERITDE